MNLLKGTVLPYKKLFPLYPRVATATLKPFLLLKRTSHLSGSSRVKVLCFVRVIISTIGEPK